MYVRCSVMRVIALMVVSGRRIHRREGDQAGVRKTAYDAVHLRDSPEVALMARQVDPEPSEATKNAGAKRFHDSRFRRHTRARWSAAWRQSRNVPGERQKDVSDVARRREVQVIERRTARRAASASRT